MPDSPERTEPAPAAPEDSEQPSTSGRDDSQAPLVMLVIGDELGRAGREVAY